MKSWTCRVACCLLPAFCLAAPAHRAAAEGGGIILARVGSEIITTGDLRAIGQDPAQRKAALDTLVERKLLIALARRMALQVGASEVERAFNEIAASYPSPEVFYRELAVEGLTVDQYKTRLSDELLAGRVVSAVIRPEVRVDPRDVQRFCLEIQADEARRREVRFTLKAFGSREEIPVSRDELAAALGEPITVSLERLTPEVRAVLEGLAPGEMSAPFLAQERWMVLKLEEHGKAPEPASENDLIRAAGRAAYQAAFNRAYRERIDTLRAEIGVRYFEGE